VELIAEGDDRLMEEFFEKGTIPEEDLVLRCITHREENFSL